MDKGKKRKPSGQTAGNKDKPKKFTKGGMSGAVVRPPPGMVRTGGNFAQLGVARGNEKKFIDTSPGTAVDSTVTTTLLNGSVPGSGATNRVGRAITIQSLYIRFCISAGATPTNALFRILVIVDRQANGLAPPLTDILVSNTPVALNNLDNRGRFVTLMDYMDVIDTAQQFKATKVLYLRKKIGVVYNSGTAGTIADIATNSVFWVAFSDLGAGATAPVALGRARIRFTDD